MFCGVKMTRNQIITFVLKLRDKKIPVPEITRQLTMKGALTMRGTQFTQSTVYGLLRTLKKKARPAPARKAAAVRKKKARRAA